MPKLATVPFSIWIQPLSDRRKHCHQCEASITSTNQHVSVGEYQHGKYRSSFYSCGQCLINTIESHLLRKGPYIIRVRSGYRMPWYVGREE